ncbi:MAG TPA: S1C family serine protease, partial [Pyrinomonadaceae bacterium]|nr:S1C family serine protease [Pyrinomonadaceae bacterium]
MKTKILFLAILAFLFHTNSIEAQKKRPVSKAKVLSSRQIAEKVMPSVVLIITQDENGNPISQGSGFVFKSGLVVSNLHVFERASNAIVKNVKTGEISKAVEVVGMNARQDICIIRIDNIKFPVIETGDSHAVKTGDDVYVASNPKGLEG